MISIAMSNLTKIQKRITKQQPNLQIVPSILRQTITEAVFVCAVSYQPLLASPQKYVRRQILEDRRIGIQHLKLVKLFWTCVLLPSKSFKPLKSSIVCLKIDGTICRFVCCFVIRFWILVKFDMAIEIMFLYPRQIKKIRNEQFKRPKRGVKVF